MMRFHRDADIAAALEGPCMSCGEDPHEPLAKVFTFPWTVRCRWLRATLTCSPLNYILQFADVNAFLTLAATRHRITTDELREKPRVQEILNAAKEGKVPVYLVSSESSISHTAARMLSACSVDVQTYPRRIHWRCYHTTRPSYPF